MKDFKFFEKERIFSEYMDRMDDYFLGGIQEPPLGVSYRHWNMLPQDIRNGNPRYIQVYIDGWEACINPSMVTNPYDGGDGCREMWNRGYMACFNRRIRVYNETDMEYYHTEEFMFFDVTEIRYDYEDGLPYKVMLFRNIEDGSIVQGQRINSSHPMYNFPDII